MLYINYFESPLGSIRLLSDGEAIIGLYLEGQPLGKAFIGSPLVERQLPVFQEAGQWLREYFSGSEPSFLPRLSLRGTEFQRQVWALLQNIPYGSIITYGELARQVAALRGVGAMSAQAVGGAVGRNPISIMVPCHRVVGSRGQLTGYAGGLEKKAYLLKLEGMA